MLFKQALLLGHRHWGAVAHSLSCTGGGGLLSHEGTKPGQLALAIYCQLEADIDDVLAAQVVKCLVHLSTHMLQADRAAGLAPAATSSNSPGRTPDSLSTDPLQAAAMLSENGLGSQHSEGHDIVRDHSTGAGSGSDEEEDPQDGMAGAAGLTLQGLVRRMVKLAGDR